MLLIEVYHWTRERPELALAREVLKQALELRPKHAPTHAVLGFIHDQGGADGMPMSIVSNAGRVRGAKEALACMREASRLNPRDKIYEIYWITLLAESGREKEALAAMKAAASRHDVDLKELRRELAKARFKADARSLLQGFIRGRNFLRSRLSGQAERIQNQLQPGRARREAEAQLEACLEDQSALERSFDAARVPAAFRSVSRWASRYGVGDDYCRPYLLKRLTKKQRTELVRAVDRHAKAIDAWLDAFPEGKMTAEAAAFMYLASGADEIRDS